MDDIGMSPMMGKNKISCRFSFDDLVKEVNLQQLTLQFFNGLMVPTWLMTLSSDAHFRWRCYYCSSEAYQVN
ncbi:hypothetical protein LINPERHAP1_LOCUS40467 [Linum perenne]